MKEQHDGDRLRILMSRAGISQAILANALEVSPTAVSTTWLQRGNIGREHIPGICRLLRCTADELLGLVPIATPMAVAEARSSYMLLKPDAKIMLEKYLSADDGGKDALQKVGDAVAQPTPARKVRVNR